MTTPPISPNTPAGAFNPVNLGASLVISAPLPDVTPFLLRPEDFLTLRDGEMSEVRSLRDISIGAFIAGAVAIASQLATLDWKLAAEQGRHPVFWTVVLLVITATALFAAAITQALMTHMRTRSAYSRLIATISSYFGIVELKHGFLSRLSAIFTGRTN
jgi:hypothetical protein